MSHDVEVLDEGTIMVVTPVTDRARDWINLYVEAEPWQWVGAGIGVERRMVETLVIGMQSDGLVVVPR